jgi:GNAT superfamily N-acetyltransferase
MTTRIRKLLPDDVPAVLSLMEAVLSEYGFPIDVGGWRRDLTNAEGQYGGTRGGFWAAEVDAVLVGTIALRAKEDRVCELKRFYVRSDSRGLGIGQLLYAHAEAFARTAGYQKIWLDSSRRFTQARRLYERNGFVLVEELQNEWEDNVYEKQLTG